MLTISILYDGPNYIKYVDSAFRNRYNCKWFDSELTRRFIEDIDQMKHIADDVFRDRWGKATAANNICTGSKALCLMQHTDFVVRASVCGNNCAKYIKEIASLKDLHICLNYGMDFPDPFDAYVTNINRMVSSNNEWLREYFKFETAYLSAPD